MPRKVNYGLDYGDDYDDYEDYDYDVEIEEYGEEEGPGPDKKQGTKGLWRCSICTYDNEEGMNVCDICGVMRHPLVNTGGSDYSKTVEGICKNSGASKLAKSLFAILPQPIPKEGVLFLKGDGFLTEDGNIYKLGNAQGEFYEFHKSVITQGNHHLNIAPFKFDVPSPDDVVSTGLQSSKKGLKGTVADSRSSDVSSNITQNNELKVQSNGESSDSSSSLVQKGRHDSFAKSKLSEDVLFNREISDKTLGSLPASSGVGKMSKIKSSNDDEFDIQSSEELSDSLSGRLKVRDSGSEIDCSSSKDVRPGKSENTISKEPHPQLPYKPEKWMPPQQAEDTLTQLNLAVVGHVDSGKSTLSGRLLHLSGRITQKEMHKYEKEAKLQGKGSFAYAWALDESSEERERGITMTVAVAYFDTKKYHVVVLDSPGHKDFVPNMISGATQADAAILVIDASLGAYEAGMDSGKGQTREHAQLIRSFGVDQVIVAINKMDSVGYSKDRFDLIRQQLGAFLRTCGFKDSSMSWIPLSVIENQNLVSSPSDVRFKSWYKGPYLLHAIDSLQPPTREFSKPLLMPVCDVIKSPTLGQVSACGKLEAGALRIGSKVLVMPSAVLGTVRTLERDSSGCSIARAGDNVSVTLNGVDASYVRPGGVLCHPDFPVKVASHLELKVLVLEGANPILVGSQLEFHIHHAKEPARVSKIVSVLDPKTGKATKKSPRCLIAKQSAVVEVILQEPVCVLESSSCKALGRVSLRALGRTIAVGLVTRIMGEQD
ncbi:hypothetical protein K1719_001807 [Acacia pycnantha]|nr:hypothetical protein K1719_001807 [Acacia pycnantha]